jgi:tight adherence protein C
MVTTLSFLALLTGGSIFVSSLSFPKIQKIERPPLPKHLLDRRKELEKHPLLTYLEKGVLLLTPKIRNHSLTLSLTPWIEERIQRISYPFGFLPEEWVSCAYLSAILSGLFLLLLFFSPLAFLIGGGIGFLFPFLYIKSRVEKEIRGILKAFPDFLDTTTLLLEAGLDIATAMERYMESTTSPLFHHLKLLVLHLKAGGRLIDGINEMERNLKIPELDGFFATLTESLKTGGSLAPILRVQSDLLRQQRFERAEKQAQEAVVKMILPLMLIFAAVLTIILGPLLSQFLGGF